MCHFRGDKLSVFGILNLNNDVLSHSTIDGNKRHSKKINIQEKKSSAIKDSAEAGEVNVSKPSDIFVVVIINLNVSLMAFEF